MTHWKLGAVLGGLIAMASPVAAEDQLVVEGNPPLTRKMLRDTGDMLEWALDVGLSATERQTLEGFIIDEWKRRDRAEMDETLKGLEAWKTIANMPARDKAALRAKMNPVESLRAEARTDPLAKWALGIYERAHPARGEDAAKASAPAPSATRREAGGGGAKTEIPASKAVPGGRAGVDLEPVRVGNTALARPRGWVIKQAEEGKWLMYPGPGGPEALITMTHGTPSKDGERSQQMMDQIIARYVGAKVLSRDQSGGWERETAILDVEHKGRPGRLGLDIRIYYVTGGLQVRTTVMLFANAQEFERSGGEDLLTSVATSIQAVGEVKASELEGSWEAIEGRTDFHLYKSGNWAGSGGSGHYVRIDLRGGRYKFFHLHTTDGPLITGWIATEHAGTYETDGNTITLRYSTCTERAKTDGRPTKTTRCEGRPYVLTVSRGRDTGTFNLTGLGLRTEYDTGTVTMNFARVASGK